MFSQYTQNIYVIHVCIAHGYLRNEFSAIMEPDDMLFDFMIYDYDDIRYGYSLYAYGYSVCKPSYHLLEERLLHRAVYLIYNKRLGGDLLMDSPVVKSWKSYAYVCMYV